MGPILAKECSGVRIQGRIPACACLAACMKDLVITSPISGERGLGWYKMIFDVVNLTGANYS